MDLGLDLEAVQLPAEAPLSCRARRLLAGESKMGGANGGGGRSGKMVNYINYRMRVTLSDTRMLVGKFLAFDKHMNLVLSDCEEFRRISGKREAASVGSVRRRERGVSVMRGLRHHADDREAVVQL
jgi:small nuclear ribonucleoprotein B and B'